MELSTRLEQAFEVGATFIHGDCKGVDAEAHDIARRIGYTIEIYPPTDPKHRAFCEGDVVHPPAPYLERNELILLAVDSMLIVPDKAMKDAPRSGTWWTYRKAIEMHVPRTLIVGGRFEFTAPPRVEYVEPDPVPLPPLKVESWRELPPPGQPGVPGDGVH
jgi:hypothetical protein